MRGRPRKQRISIARDERRSQFRVEIPPSLGAGKRIQKFFPDRPSAELWVAERELERLRDGEINVQAVTGGSPTRTAVSAHLADRQQTSDGHQRLLRIHLGKLSSRFPDMGRIDPLQCRKWIVAMPAAQRTKHGVFSSCRSFFRWALRYGYAESSPFDRMEPIPKGDSPKAILTPGQMDAILDSQMPSYVRFWLILGGFCGLRPVEVYRLDWSAVDLDAKEIHVGRDVIKKTRGMRERYVEIPQRALDLLPTGMSGPVVPVHRSNFQIQVAKLSKILGVPAWPRDCLRHSAASYMLALKGDAGWVANWLGHTTTKMVYEAYARAVPRADALKWYAIQGS